MVATHPPSAEVCQDDPRVRACRVHTSAGDHLPLDLAAGHGSIALVYAELALSRQDQGAPGVASMILHDRELRPIGEARIQAPGRPQDLSLVATADGWLVALQAEGAVHMVQLDRRGRELGERQVIADATAPRLVADGPRAPLLAWDGGYTRGFMAQAVVMQGSPPPLLKLFERTTEPNFAGQIAVAPGEFLVARRADRGIAVRRLSARGELRSHHADVGPNTEYPTLARCDDGPRMIWSDFARRAHVALAEQRPVAEVGGGRGGNVDRHLQLPG